MSRNQTSRNRNSARPAPRRPFNLSKIVNAAKGVVLKAALFAGGGAPPHTRPASTIDSGRGGVPQSVRTAAGKTAARGAVGAKSTGRRKDGAPSLIDYEEAKSRVQAIENAPHFPIEALGELGPLASILSTELQVDPALAGTCLLFAANVATTGHVNVQVFYNSSAWKATTLNLHTLAHSGQGKTTTDDAVLGPLRAVFDRLAEEYAKLPADEKGKRRHLHRILEDMSEAAFVSELAAGPRMQAVSTSEGAAFYFSHAMNRDNLQKTAATFCKLWDDGRLSRVRLTTARTELFGLRVPLHISVQPEIIEPFLSNDLLNACGYWPRNLLAICRPPLQRVLKQVDLQDHPEFRKFAARCQQLAAQLEPERAEDCQQIGWEPEAARFAAEYFNGMEEALAHGDFIEIDAWARRATDQVQRVAATLAAFAGRTSISVPDVKGAAQIVDYSLACWRFVKSEKKDGALRLWKWVKENGGTADTSKLIQYGPVPTRSARKRDEAIDLLRDKGLMRRDGKSITLL